MALHAEKEKLLVFAPAIAINLEREPARFEAMNRSHAPG
jgi:hypothetical protein